MGCLIDCHIHTERCGHAKGSAAEYLEAARERGLAAIVFAEHLPLPDPLDPERRLSMPECDLASYADEIAELRSRFDDVDVVLGAEADWLPSWADQTSAMRAAADALGVRVLLGSVHFLDSWAFDDPTAIHEWDGRNVDLVWTEYFAAWSAAARSGLFDVMAHPDLVKKFGHRPSFDTSDIYAAAADAAADSGVIVEVSSAGLRKPVGELYPGPDLLRAFRDAGVPATTGSDAHSPDEVGLGLEEACAAMRAAGYEKATFPLGEGAVRHFDL
jgi:histidinol-phosphatase (PHP family)